MVTKKKTLKRKKKQPVKYETVVAVMLEAGGPVHMFGFLNPKAAQTFANDVAKHGARVLIGTSN